jgi:hypothetical protein
LPGCAQALALLLVRLKDFGDAALQLDAVYNWYHVSRTPRRGLGLWSITGPEIAYPAAV